MNQDEQSSIATVLAVLLHPLLTARDVIDHWLNYRSYGAREAEGYMRRILLRELRMTGVSIGSLLLACGLLYAVALPGESGWVIVGLSASLYLLFGVNAYSAQQQYASAIDQFSD